MFFEVTVRNEGNEKNPKKKERKNSKAHQLPPRLPERRPHHGLRQTPRVLLDQRQQVVGDPGPAGGRGAARAPPLLVLRRGCWLRRRRWCRCRPVADERDVRPRLVEGRGGLCVRGLPLEESQPGVDGVEEAAEGRAAEGRGRGRRWNRGIIIGHRRRQRGGSRCRSCCCCCGCGRHRSRERRTLPDLRRLSGVQARVKVKGREKEYRRGCTGEFSFSPTAEARFENSVCCRSELQRAKRKKRELHCFCSLPFPSLPFFFFSLSFVLKWPPPLPRAPLPRRRPLSACSWSSVREA